MSEPTKSKFNYGALVVPILAIGVILYFVLTNPEVKNLGSAFMQFNPWYLFGIFICVAVYVGTETAILQIGCNLFPGKMNYARSLKTSLIGLYYNAITPFASGGYPVKVNYMKKWDVPTAASSGLMVLSVYFWHIWCSVLSIIAFIFYRSMLFSNMGLLIAAIVGISVSLVLSLGATLIMFKVNLKPLILFFVRLLKKIRIIKKTEAIDNSVNKWIEDFNGAFTILKKYPSSMMKMLALTALKLLGYMSVTYVLYRGFGFSDKSYIDITLLQMLVTSSVLFVPIPGATGASEGIFYIMFSSIFTNGMTLPAMLLWRGFTYYIFIFIGALISIIDGINSFRLRLVKNKLK